MTNLNPGITSDEMIENGKRYGLWMQIQIKNGWKEHLESGVFTGLNTETALKKVEEELKELEAEYEAKYYTYGG